MKSKIFYGWWIVAAGCILSVINGAIFTIGFTAFVNPIVATYGWTYAQVSLGSSIRTVESGAFNPLMGMAVDRWPAKWLALIGVLLMGLGIILLSRANNLFMFYTSFVITGIGSSMAISMVPTTLIARWFRKDLGKATGLLSAGVGIGGAFVPLMSKVIEIYGYQTVLVWIGCGIMLGGIPLCFVFRDRPEKYGMLPDGVTQTEEKKKEARKAAAASMTLREAARTRAFWFMGVGFFVQMAAVNSVGVHIMPYLTGMGISRTVAATVAMTASIVSIACRVGFGTISDYFKVKYCSAISIGLTSLAMFLLWNVNGSIALAFVFAVIHGAGQGGMSPLRSPLIRQYFGVKYFGTVFGMTSLFVTVGQMLGAPVTGWVKDTSGDYHSQWLLLGFAALVGAIMMLLVPTTAKSSSHQPVDSWQDSCV